MAILSLEKIAKVFFQAPEIQRKLGQRVTAENPLDTSFECTTYLTVFGDGASLMSDKEGSVNIMAAFRNAAFVELLLGGEEYEAEFLRKGEAAGWQHTCSIHNIGWGHVNDDGPHNKALAMKIMEFIRKVHKQGFYYDEETGLTFAVRVGVSNDLKAMGLWFGRGGSSASKYQHCNWNEVHM